MIEKTTFFKIGVWYAITIAPDDALQFFGKNDRHRLLTDVMNSRLLTYATKKIDYVLHLELSEPHVGKFPTQGPRLHYHGKIRFRSKAGLKQWLLTNYYELLIHTIIDIDTIDDMDTWNKYCWKQSDIINMLPLNNIKTTTDNEDDT